MPPCPVVHIEEKSFFDHDGDTDNDFRSDGNDQDGSDDVQLACDLVPLTRASATRIQAAAKQTTDCHLTKSTVKFNFRRETKIPNKRIHSCHGTCHQ